MDAIFTLKDLVAPVLAGQWSGVICSTEESDKGATLVLEYAAKHRSLCAEVTHQDKVVVLVDNSISAISALMVMWDLGAVVVPVKRDMTEEAVQTIAEDCNAKYILDPLQQTLSPTGFSTSARVEFLSRPKVTGVDLALIIYTSGSTGKPKGIMLTHANVIAALRAILDYLKITSDDTLLVVSPMSFDYGLYQLLFTLAKGCKLVLYNKSVNPMQLIKLVNDQGVTVLPFVPALATSVAKYLETFKKTVSGVRLITSTGGVFPTPVVESLKRTFDRAKILKMYGLTESKRVAYLPADLLASKPESVGIPMPGLDAKIFTESCNSAGEFLLKEVPYGEIGQLYVRGSSVFQKYYNAENGAGATLVGGGYRDDNWLGTGDLFSQDEEGFLYFRGRVKELIKQNGFCLYPRDSEAIVYTNPNVELCKICGSKDKDENEIAHLVVVLKDDSDAERNNFKSWLSTSIDRDYQPRAVTFLEEMPLSANGKIDVSKVSVAL